MHAERIKVPAFTASRLFRLSVGEPLDSRKSRVFVPVVFAELHIMRYAADGLFQIEREMPLRPTSEKN
jgi:hypothetical protein